jgi:hypothetical protein
MAGKRIDELREILTKAAARDAELQQALETLAGDLLKELGGDDKPPVWAEIKAADRERQITPTFVMEDMWLRGDLVIAVTPEQKFVVSLVIRDAPQGRHEAGSQLSRSQTVIIDPPEPTDRDKARKKFFDGIFANLEGQVRARVALPAA